MSEVDLNTEPFGPDDGGAGPAITIVTINGKKFVSGLFWKPLTKPRSYMTEAREIGKKNGWDIVAIRKRMRIQAGFVGKSDGVLKGMYSLAAALAGQLGDTWIGAFELGNDQYAVVAVHEGSIVPGYDLICDQATAMERLRTGYNLFDFRPEAIFAPSSFKFSERSKDISELLQSKALKAEYKLKQLSFGLTTKELTIVALVGVLTIGGVYGYKEYLVYAQRKAREEQIRQQQLREAELARLNALSKNKQGEAAVEHPWASMPAALDFVEGCRQAYKSVPLSLAGWTLTEVECTMQNMKVSYKRPEDGPTLKQFAARVPYYFDVEPVFLDQPAETASLMLPLKVAFGGDDVLEPVPVMQIEFKSHFQALGIKASLVEKEVPGAAPPPKPLPGQVAQPVPPPPTWRKFEFGYETTLPPNRQFQNLQHKAGVRVTKVSMKLDAEPAELKWNISGDMYAKR